MPGTPLFAAGSIVIAALACGVAPSHAEGLGVEDAGIWSDLDDQVRIALPDRLTRDRVEAVVAAGGATMILYVDGWPTKPYPWPLRAADRAELDGLVDDANTRRLAEDEAPPHGDRDRDGLPDPLDVLIGAKKTAIEAWPYGGGYMELDYPMGDVPRRMGVCTDVVIRALRNAGLDLQAAVVKDIKRRPKAYPMVKRRPDPNIDHRRVKTILPWFQKHAERLDDDDALRPGDIVFMDTFPDRAGPDHIGILSDTIGASGRPLVINAWTDGYDTQEMDLLDWVPVTHRFRL